MELLRQAADPKQLSALAGRLRDSGKLAQLAQQEQHGEPAESAQLEEEQGEEVHLQPQPGRSRSRKQAAPSRHVEAAQPAPAAAAATASGAGGASPAHSGGSPGSPAAAHRDERRTEAPAARCVGTQKLFGVSRDNSNAPRPFHPYFSVAGRRVSLRRAATAEQVRPRPPYSCKLSAHRQP